MGTPLSWPPFQWSSVLVPPQTCLNYQTRSSGTIQPSLPLRALWLLHTTTHKNTRNLSTKSSKRGGPHAHARARLPWLPQTSTPRRQATFSIILQAGGFGGGLSGVVRGCGIKRTWAGLRSSAVTLLRWRLLLCLGSFPQSLPGRALPLRARSLWSALWTQMVVNSRPKRLMETHLWKEDDNDAASCGSPCTGPLVLHLHLIFFSSFRKLIYSSWNVDDNH